MEEDFKSSSGLWLMKYNVGGVLKQTKSYRIWNHMMSRCNAGGSYQRTQPTYIGCTVAEEFQDYQKFAEWYTAQIGYGLPQYELDKDILKKGNKVYCPELCVLVPGALNKFLTDTGAKRGAYPQGVSAFKKTGKFQTRMSIDGQQHYLGVYVTPEAAHHVYVDAKEREAKRWADRIVGGEFAADPRLVDSLRNWTLH